MSRAIDGATFANVSTSQQFSLESGGLYGVDVVATFGGGSVKLQRLGPDGSTYQSVSSTTDFTAAGYQTVNLPAGSYQFTIATATAVYARLRRIPGE